MKPIADKSMDAFEDVALDGVRQLKAFFTYQGENAAYFQKARLGAVAISGFARIRASETNRIQTELAAKKHTGK
jgi:hypothetical protein